MPNRDPNPRLNTERGRERTPEEIALARKAARERKAREEARREAEEKRKKAKRKEILSFFMAGIMILGGLLVVGSLIFLGIKALGNRRNQVADAHSFRLSDETRVENGIAYLNFSDLAKKMEWGRVGDAQSMTFRLPEDDTAGDEETNRTVVLTVGSSECEIAGEKVSLIGPVLLSAYDYWTPVDLVNAHISGLKASAEASECPLITKETVKDEKGTVSEIVPTLSATRLIPLPEIPGTTAPAGETSEETTEEVVTTEPLTTEDPVEAIISSVTFSQDLSAFEEYMNPTGEMRDAFLLLINRQKRADKNYVPDSLTVLPKEYTYNDGRTVEMVETAEKAMEAMFRELFAAGFKKMHVTSGYRSYAYQEKLYNNYVSREIEDAKKNGKTLSREAAEKIVDTYSAKAGTSEHQSGLCADMHNLSSADVKFAKTNDYAWLCENAWKFGFILRFPEDKEEITGYSFEPWHWRFVGRYHAYRIWSEGLCLEEYLERLSAGNAD
ncbi:MAG: M15 family metallopeptidase [Clostridia bacterium]|nr:M15 family metallopeptidase [Clostridia bacterium]